MKNTILFGAFLLCYFFAFGQGNLQFNQVLLLNSTLAADANLGTVPANKVWKIESFGGNCGGSTRGTLNGSPAGALSRGSTVADLQNSSWTLPVWLPAGTQLGFTNGCSGSLIWYSIIEFNIVP